MPEEERKLHGYIISPNEKRLKSNLPLDENMESQTSELEEQLFYNQGEEEYTSRVILKKVETQRDRESFYEEITKSIELSKHYIRTIELYFADLVRNIYLIKSGFNFDEVSR